MVDGRASLLGGALVLPVVVEVGALVRRRVGGPLGIGAAAAGVVGLVVGPGCLVRQGQDVVDIRADGPVNGGGAVGNGQHAGQGNGNNRSSTHVGILLMN